MDWIEIIEREGHALSAAARHDTTAAIPSCPGWDVDELLKHVSSAHRWANSILRDRRMDRGERATTPPKGGSLSWYEAGLAEFLETLRGIDPSTPVWTFGPDRTANFWFRRQAHETAVHRVDAEQATGAVTPIDPAFAADGIAESLEVMVPRLARDNAKAGGTLHLHTTDTEGEWLLRFQDGAVEVELGHAKGDAAVRGPAADLYLWMWGRGSGDLLERFGDPELPERFIALSRV